MIKKIELKKLFLWCLGIICFIFLAIVTIQYDIQVNGNCSTALSGLWSAAATLGIGLIAFWQNKRYKKLADEANDLAFKPEIYIPDSVIDQNRAINGCFFSTMKAVIPSVECVTLHKIVFQGIRLPIIQLMVIGIECNNIYFGCNSEARTITDNSPYFGICFDIPKSILIEKTSCIAEVQYKNIYGTVYKKKICFTAYSGNKTPQDIRLKKAMRIYDSNDILESFDD